MEVVGGAAPALFDLESDPSERHNLAEVFPDVARAFRDELHAMVADARARRAHVRRRNLRLSRVA